MDESTVEQLQAQVEALVTELAQKQEMVERARIEGQREIIQQIETAIYEALPGYRLPAVEQVILNWHDINT